MKKWRRKRDYRQKSEICLRLVQSLFGEVLKDASSHSQIEQRTRGINNEKHAICSQLTTYESPLRKIQIKQWREDLLQASEKYIAGNRSIKSLIANATGGN